MCSTAPAGERITADIGALRADIGALRADTGALRAAAADLAVAASQLGRGLGDATALVPTAPGWATTRALAELEAATHAWLCRMGTAAARAAEAVRAAADGYDAADERAARRLHAARGR